MPKPTKRFETAPGMKLVVMELALGRGRIAHSDGVMYDEFW